MPTTDYARGARDTVAAFVAMTRDLPMNVWAKVDDVEIVNGATRAIVGITWGPLGTLRTLLDALDESPTIAHEYNGGTVVVLEWAHPRGVFRSVVTDSDLVRAGLAVAA